MAGLEPTLLNPIYRLLAHIRLREANPGDLPGITALEADVQAVPWSQRLFASCMSANYCTLVLQHRARLCGFAVLYSTPGELHLMNIAIAPQYQHRGLARYLLSRIQLQARREGATRILLEVRRSNRAAALLYEASGYRAFGTRENYYLTVDGTHEDARLYELVL